MQDENNSPRSNLHHGGAFGKVRLYIMDDCDQEGEQSPMQRLLKTDEHKTRCMTVRVVVEELLACEVRSVKGSESGAGQGPMIKWWTEDLADMGVDDLVIVYFHGRTGGKGSSFTGFQQECFPRTFKWHSIVRIFSQPGMPHAQFVLDAWVDESNRHWIMRRSGNTEIIAPGKLPLTQSGHAVSNENFTTVLMNRLNLFQKTLEDKPAKVMGRTNKTLAQLLATANGGPRAEYVAWDPSVKLTDRQRRVLREDAEAAREMARCGYSLSSKPLVITASQSKAIRLEPVRRLVILARESAEEGRVVFGIAALPRDYDPNAEEVLELNARPIREDDLIDEGFVEGVGQEGGLGDECAQGEGNDAGDLFLD